VTDRARADLDGVFGALADPTRRGLYERLLADGPDTATNLVEDLPVTRQAVVKHLHVLAEAGLVSAERHGREVRYAASPEPLTPAVGWMVATGARWDRRLDRLRERLAKSEPERT
jgi:DNA-binding transcriptional ArsR family regulator